MSDPNICGHMCIQLREGPFKRKRQKIFGPVDATWGGGSEKFKPVHRSYCDFGQIKSPGQKTKCHSL